VSSSDQFPGIPQTRDTAPNWAADTDPVGPVTPELALVDPGLTRGQTNNEVTMSSMQFDDARVPIDGQPSVPLQPIEPLVPAASTPEVAPPVVEPAAAPAVSAVPVGDMRDVPLGTLVFRAGLLPEERLEEALQEGMKTGKRLGEILLERGWVSEVDLGRLLAGQKGLPFVELDPSAVDPTAPPLLHPEKARLHGALPIGFEGGVPVVAVADPSNDLVVENVRRALACEPVLVVAGRDALQRAISQVYGAEAPVVDQQEQAAVVEPVAPIVPAEPVAEVHAPLAPMVEPVTPFVPEPAVPLVTPPVETPSVATQPVENGDGLWLGPQPQIAQQPEPVPYVEPIVPVEPVEPVAPVEPVQQQPAGAAEPVPDPVAPQPETVPVAPVAQEPVTAVTPEPVAATVQPAPAVEPIAAPAPQPELEPTWAVVLRLANGERLELGSFAGEAAAVEQARIVVTQVSTDGGWPFVGGRFIRPDAIVSVDLVEHEASRWLGSQARAAALSPHQQPTA
jgi:hypothetical protein